MEQDVRQRLTAVLAADVVGYSSLLKSDESGTLDALRGLRGEVIEPLVAAHNGSIIKRMGDGWLIGFTSARTAVNCAIAIQEECNSRDQLKLRVGVHVGDVVFEDEDLFGDGVNIASRLQSICASGAVLVSDIVHRSLDQKLGHRFDSYGLRSLKNISDPVGIFGWAPSGAPTQPLPEVQAETALTVAVLPFDNLSRDDGQEFFADGITEEIITTLSKIPGLLVVARNSTFVYKGRSVDVKQVGIEQGVRYVLEGSIRGAGSRVRVTAQLIDAQNAMHIWADRFDRDIADVFEVQDEIALRIATELQVELLDGEMARFRGSGTKDLRAWDQQMRAVACSRTITRESFAEARRFAERAIALDPEYSAPLCTLGFVNTVEARHGFSPSRPESLAAARDCANRALALDAYNPEAHAVLGFADAIEGDLEAAIQRFGTALAQNPNHSDVTARLSLTLTFNDQAEDAVRMAEHSIRLSPNYPGWYAGVYGFALRLAGRYDEAIEAFLDYGRKSKGFGLVDLAIVHAARGDVAAARAAAKAVLTHRPDFTIDAWAKTQLYAKPERLDADRAALLAAGLPEA